MKDHPARHAFERAGRVCLAALAVLAAVSLWIIVSRMF